MKLNRNAIVFGLIGVGMVSVSLWKREAIAQSVKEFVVKLQDITPGILQTGHINISGKVLAGGFKGNGSQLMDLNASNLTSGTLPIERIGVPIVFAMNNAGQATMTIENTAPDSTALNVWGGLKIGTAGEFRVDPITGNALSQGTVTANGIFSADDSSFGGDVTIGNTLDMTTGGIFNIGSGGSSFDEQGNLTVPGRFQASYANAEIDMKTITGFMSLRADQQIAVTSPDITLNGDVSMGDFFPQLSVNVAGDETLVASDLSLLQKVRDVLGSAGTPGQVLTSTGAATKWANLFGADGESIVVNGGASIGGASSPRLFEVLTTPTPKVEFRTNVDLIGGGLSTNNSIAFAISSGTPATPNFVNSPVNNSLGFHTNNVERIRISPTGSVNIGTTTGPGRLNVNGNLIMSGTGSIFAVDTTIASFSGQGRMFSFVGAGGWGTLVGRNGSGQDRLVITPLGTGTDAGIGVLNNAATTFIGGVIKREQSNTSELIAQVKNFVEPNPLDPETDIYYATIEGPEAAMYIRGTARLQNGRATITLPDHFRALADDEGMTVQLTPLSFESEGLAVGSKSHAGIVVGELRNGKGNYEFDWEVKARRKSFRDYKVTRPWEKLLMPSADREKAWDARLRQIRESQR